MAKILLVEDDTDYAAVIRDGLLGDRHTIEIVHSGQEAIDLLAAYRYDLVILDWELPDLCGPDVCKKYRSGGGSTPILMLTGKAAVEHKEMGLDSGMDDFVTKPVHPKELSARVRALLRRTPEILGDTLTVRDVTLDTRKHTATRKNEPLDLLPREFALLQFLMRNQNQVYSAEALIDHVWSSDVDVSAETVRTCVNRLRIKLDVDGQPSLVRTIYGVGYTIDGEKV